MGVSICSYVFLYFLYFLYVSMFSIFFYIFYIFYRNEMVITQTVVAPTWTRIPVYPVQFFCGELDGGMARAQLWAKGMSKPFFLQSTNPNSKNIKWKNVR